MQLIPMYVVLACTNAMWHLPRYATPHLSVLPAISKCQTVIANSVHMFDSGRVFHSLSVRWSPFWERAFLPEDAVLGLPASNPLAQFERLMCHRMLWTIVYHFIVRHFMPRKSIIIITALLQRSEFGHDFFLLFGRLGLYNELFY